MSKVTLKIIGENKMNCGGCEGNVRNTLSMLPGVAEVVADRNTQLVEVKLSSDEFEAQTLVDQLNTIGYQAEVA